MSMLQSHRLSAILLAKSAASTPTTEPVLAAAKAGTAPPVEEAVTGANAPISSEPVVSPEAEQAKKTERRRQIMAVLLPTLLGGAYGGAVGSLLPGKAEPFPGSAALGGAGVGAGIGAGLGGAHLLLAKYLGIDPLTNVPTHMKTASSPGFLERQREAYRNIAGLPVVGAGSGLLLGHVSSPTAFSDPSAWAAASKRTGSLASGANFLDNAARQKGWRWAGKGALAGGGAAILLSLIEALRNKPEKTASSRLDAVKLAQALHEMETKEASGLARLAFSLGPRAVSGLNSLGRQATRWGGNPALGNTGLRSYVSRAGRYADEWQKPLQAPTKGSYRTQSGFERAQRGYANRVKERPAGWDARQGKVVNTKPTPEAAQAPGRMGRAWDWYKNSPKAQIAGNLGTTALGWTGLESIVGGARARDNQARGAAAALQYYQQMPMWQKLMMSFQGPEAMQQYVPSEIMPYLQELQRAQQYRI